MDRRAHYLATALRLFAERGYRGVSIDEVVAAAGGSKATLYRYFRSKEALFEAIIADLGATIASDDAVLEPAKDTAEGLRTLGSAIARAALSEEAIVLLRLALAEHTRFPELGRTLFAQGPAVSYERFREFVQAEEKKGNVVVPDLDIAAEQFIGGIVGHQQLRMALGISTPSPAEVAARVDAAVDAFLATYGARSVVGAPAAARERTTSFPDL